MLFLLSLAVTLFTVYQINRFFQYEKLFDWVLGGFLILISVIVFEFTIIGLFYQMNNQWVVLAFQIALMGITRLLTWKLKKQLHPVPAIDKEVFDRKQYSFIILAFAGIMAGILVLNLVYVLFVPPSNNDSLMIHLARIGMWHQTGSWLPWNTPAIWQLTFPFNGEMMAYWTLLFLKRETLLAFFPLLCGVLSAGIINFLGVELFKNKKFSLFASTLWLTFPAVQLNLSSSRHDHISTLLLLSAFYFLVKGMKTRTHSNWVFVGLSLALSVGTNMAVATYLPGYAVVFLSLWLFMKKLSFSEFIQIGVASLVSFLLISSPIFISNMIHFGTPISPDADTMVGVDVIESGSPIEHFVLMNGRWTYQLVDCCGLPDPLSGYCHKAKYRVAEWVSTKIGWSLEREKSLFNQFVFTYEEHYPLTEDSAWYGLLGTFVFIIVGGYSIFKALKHKELFYILTDIFLLTIPFVQVILWSGWKPYDGRYFMFLAALLCVGLVGLLCYLKPAWSKWLTFVAVGFAAIILGVTTMGNPAKSFVGYRAFYNQHRLDSVSIQSYFTKEMLYLVDQTVPEDGVLGIARSDREFYEYGLFGERFTRKIIPVYPLDNVCDEEWLKENGIDYLLLDAEDQGFPDCEILGYFYENSMKQWLILAED